MSTVDVIKNRDEHRIRELRSFDFAALARSGGMKRETPETAPEVPAVIACIRVIAESVGSLPLHIYRMDSNGAKVLATDSPLYRLMRYAPNDEQTSLELREQLVMLYLLYGDAYCELQRDDRGTITAMMPLHPSRMTTERLTDGSLRYIYREPSGRQTIYNQRQLWHLRMPTLDGVHGISLPSLVKDAIAQARALEAYGLQYFANGARPGVCLTSDNPIPAEAAERMREQWERMHRGPDRAHRTAVLPNGLKVHELSGSNESSQFVDARKMAVVEICRAFRVPPHLVQSLDGATYSNIEHQSREFLTYTLLPHLRRIEDSIARDLIDDPNLFAEHDVHAFMRGDSAARAAWYQQAMATGILSVNEVRSMEGLNPIGPEGDERFMQVNMTTLKQIASSSPVEGQAEEGDQLAVAESGEIQQQALNGAQVSALLEIVAAVSGGLLSNSGASALIESAFPTLDSGLIEKIVSGSLEIKQDGT
jgi:HK97 family phage portal protein